MKYFISLLLISITLTPIYSWFLVPMAYWDKEDKLTTYCAIGFGDTTKYGALELRYAPEKKATRVELNLRLPLFGEGTSIQSRFIDATTNDPRKPEIYLADSDTAIEDITEKVSEFSVRLNQRYRAGIETEWGLFATYKTGKYQSDYTLSESGGWEQIPETTSADYIGGGILFGYDGRNGNLDPDKGYVFHIEVGGDYLLQDTLKADYVNAADNTSKIVGHIFVEQYIYTPTTDLPVDIPLFTVHAPTVIGVRTTAAYKTDKVSQLNAYRSGDFELFRGMPHRQLAGYAFYILSVDFRIKPIKRMFTPMTLLYILAPRIFNDARATVEFTPFIDIGKIYSGDSDKQFYTFGGGIALGFTKTLTPRIDFMYCPKYKQFTTYFGIRHPF
ncbi:hypothetical protein DRQ33_08210 [bacterium]|nr:MAG: hypothetical protein DRQ33_08210 [bacterium]